MVDIFPPVTVLTPAGAATALQANGLDALGLTVPTLSPVWASSTPSAADFNATAMTLALTNPRAPFRGILAFDTPPAYWSDVTGAPITGPVAVLQLHPEAARRLERLVAGRYGAPAVRPVPAAMVIRGITPPGASVPNWYVAGEPLGLGGSPVVSFHDSRGLVIDPIAVAAVFDDLLSALPGLRMIEGPPATEASPGGLDGIAALATGVRVHVIDPHGNSYTPTREVARLKRLNATGDEVGQVPDGGVFDLGVGETLGRSTNDDIADQARPLRWGFSATGTLDRVALAAPALPAGVTLARQFLRVTAVDLDWHLLGNRSAQTVAGISPDDDVIPDFALPRVRPAVPTFDYLPDAAEALGSASAIAAGFPPAAGEAWALVTSPVISPELPLPPAPGAAAHWPVFPGPNTGAPFPVGMDATAGITARWRVAGDGPNADHDVVITIAADAVAPGAAIRVFPRRFVEIQAIGEEQSFVRPDGGAAIAQAGTPTRVLLTNPFVLLPAEARPDPARLEVDVVVTSRTGQRRLFSVVAVDVSNNPESITNQLAQFGGTALLNTPPFAALFGALSTQSVAASPLFGIPTTVTPASGTPTSIVDMVRRLASESQPRQGPRLPTQARFETIFALGRTGPVPPRLAFDAILTGARWDIESRSARPDLGNPGNPAGPDLHAAGVRCDGQLAYDLAFHALKRAQPIIPLGAGTPGWIVASGGDNWDEPPPDAAGTVSAAMLETVAAICDSPELSFLPIPGQADSVQSAVDAAANALGLPPITITVGNEAEIRRRLQREIATAKFGQRDALWSLRRALGQAREMIYIESPMFARTARPSGTPAAHEVDLVEVIRQRMADNPRLKVVICLPRLPDFAESRAPWVRAAFKHRKEAIEVLANQDRKRVAAFHPIGFPGRSAVVRSTVVVVDDVWCLAGTSHFRRRGMTFDGAVDVVSIDRAMAGGYSAGIVQFRQELMASRLGVDVPGAPAQATSLWVRLAQPDAAFDAVADLLAQGGLGRCTPVWAGPADTSVLPQSDAVADPDGSTGADFLALFASLLSDS